MTMATPIAVDTWAAALAPPTREDDAAHRERIHAEINADFHREAAIAHDERTIPEVWQITQAIAAGRIRHLTINYQET
jgi:hypothetical protein